MSVGGWYWRWSRKVAKVNLESRRAHEIRWQFIDLAAGAAMVGFLWLTIGPVAGIAFGMLWALLMLAGLYVLYAKRRAARRSAE